MTKQTHNKKPQHAKKKNVFLKALPFAIIIAVGVFGIVMKIPRADLPAAVRDLKPTVAAYEWRDKKFPDGKTATEEPIVDKTTGYPKQDRSKIEKLISEGAHDD